MIKVKGKKKTANNNEKIGSELENEKKLVFVSSGIGYDHNIDSLHKREQQRRTAIGVDSFC